MLVWKVPSEGKEAAPETGGRPPFGAESSFDQSREWNLQVIELVKRAMGEKYSRQINVEVLTYINTGNDYVTGKFKDALPGVATMKLEDGKLSFLSEAGEVLSSFDISLAMQEIVEAKHHHDCDICRRRNRRIRLHEFRDTSWGDLLLRTSERPGATAAKAGKAKEKSGERAGRKDPLSPEKREAIKRRDALFLMRRQDRDAILKLAETWHDEEDYDFEVIVNPALAGATKEEFESQWRHLDGSDEIDRLLKDPPDPRSGYTVNPFRDLSWNHEILRDVIQGSSFLNRNDAVSFQDIEDEIFEDRFDEFTQKLKEGGTPEPVIEALDDDDLVESYKKLKRLKADLSEYKKEADVPEDKKALWRNMKHIDAVINILGDYIAYANKLVNLIGDLTYNAAKETADREATMFEETPEDEADEQALERNRVIRAMKKAFESEGENMYEYSGELNHWFAVIARGLGGEGSEARITFDDLNGQTASIEGEWFTRYQSPEAAYKLAFDAARVKTPDGSEKVDEKLARDKLNELLRVGIAAYTSRPGEKSMKKIFEELQEEGAEVEPGVKLPFSMTLADSDNLYHCLKLNDLSDIHKNDTDLEKMIAARRSMFMRIGSVIRQKESQKSGARTLESAEKKRTSARLKLTTKQARDIADKLEGTGKFKREETQRLREALVGGVAATIEGDRITGGAVNAQYKFSNGVTVTLTGGIDNWETPGVGVTVGKAFQVSSDITISIHGGVGYAFGKDAATEGWILGGGGALTKKFGQVSWSIVEAGAGITPGGIPVAFVGTGLRFVDEQASYEKTLKKKQIEHHLDELDASDDVFKKILANSSRYPEFKHLILQIQNAPSVIDKKSRRDVFMAAYDIFKDEIQKEAIDDSTPKWYERLLPTKIGAGVALVMAGKVPIPIPYAYLEFQIATRNLVFRLATPERDAHKIAEREATAAILKHYKIAGKVETRTLLMSGELAYDPKTGEHRLTQAREGKLDLSHLDKLGEFSSALYDDADIFVKPADIEGSNMGLLELNPRAADGNTKVYVDPKLKDSVVLTSKGSRLFASVKNNQQLTFKRHDVTYPFQKGDAVEETVITISDNPHTSLEVIRAESQHYMCREPKTEWNRREENLGATPEAREARKQDQIKTFEEYEEWWGEGQTDRLEFLDMSGVHEAYDRLVSSVSVRGDEVAKETKERVKIRKEMRAKIDELAGDSTFIGEYRDLSTQQFDLVRAGGTTIFSNPKRDLPKLIGEIETRVGVSDLSIDEMNYALITLMTASFQDIHKHAEVKKAYESYLDTFHAPLLTSIVGDYYKEKDDSEAAKKTKEDVDWMMAKFKKIDITTPGVAQKVGVYIASLVGMRGEKTRAVGLRHLFTFHEDDGPKRGLVGGIPLNPNAKDPVEKRVARFWLETLSPYQAGLHTKEIPDSADAAYEEYQDQMRENLYSPLALKLVPLLAVNLTPREMTALAAYYDPGKDSSGAPNAKVYVNESNIEAIRKFLGLVDQVRTAQLQGKKELDLGQGFTLLLQETSVQLGVYKQCGNVTGVMSERFQVVHKSSGQRLYFAGMGEGIIDVDVDYSKQNFYAMVGASYRPVRTQRVKKEEPPGGGGGPPPRRPVEPEPEVPRIPTGEEKPKPTPSPMPEGAVGGKGGTGSTNVETT